MHRRVLTLAALTAASALGLSACGATGTSGGGGEKADTGKPLTILADAEPHTTLLKQAEKEGLLGDVKLDIREISGQVDPNQLVASGDVDANFFQHTPYLKNWNAEHKDGPQLQMVGTVHIEPLGLYSKKVKAISETPKGANVAIPADAVNQGRALFLLEQAGLLTLNVKATDPNLDIATVGKKNITGNPKGLSFTEIDRPQLAATLDDPKVTLSIINGNYALEAGLKPSNDALALDEVTNNPYANGIVTRPELAGDPRVVKVVQALKDPKIKKFINDTYSGSVLPAEDAATPTDTATTGTATATGTATH